MDINISERQELFINATASEVLFGGAAGGGKSYAQIIDAFLFALKYPGSKQLILRRTFRELEMSLIRTALMLYPKNIYSYNSSSHTGRFTNGSIIDFGYCATEGDVINYQSAEFDVIRFDELTHFTEFQYTYLKSRVRGTNGYPKQIKSSTNPGNVGHQFVKARFIDPAPPNTEFSCKDGTRIFIPSKVQDNLFLMKSDPDYLTRLEALPEMEKRALLYGDWNVFKGQYFSEFMRDVHCLDPFELPSSWRRYRAIDYGLDMLSCLWVAVSPEREAYVYRELHESNVIVSEAARKINELTPTDEKIYATLAPPDLWSRSQESGRSKFQLFSEAGLYLTKSSNDREAGWLAIKELLKTDSVTRRPRIYIFNNCLNLIKNLPLLQYDQKRPTDTATEPHEITHDPDALRYFAVYWIRPESVSASVSQDTSRRWRSDLLEDYYRASPEERRYLESKYGKPN